MAKIKGKKLRKQCDDIGISQQDMLAQQQKARKANIDKFLGREEVVPEVKPTVYGFRDITVWYDESCFVPMDHYKDLVVDDPIIGMPNSYSSEK